MERKGGGVKYYERKRKRKKGGTRGPFSAEK